MGLFDAIRHSFNPEVQTTYDDLRRNYRKGLESFCRGTGGSYGSYQFRRIVISDNMSYSDMKFIYESRQTIKDLHNVILQTEKIESDYKELESLQRQYPHAFVSICQECLNGIIYNSGIEMPGSKQPHNTSTVPSPFAVRPITIRKKYYGGQYNPIGCNAYGGYSSFGQGKYKSEPKKVRDLLYPDAQKILQHKSSFPSRENSILTMLENEKIAEQFEQKISSNSKRKKYYKAFLLSKGKRDTDKKYVIENISLLDSYITSEIKSKAREIKDKYPSAISLINKKRYIGYGTDEQIIAKESEIAELESHAKRYLQLEKKYPNGLPAFERYNSFDDGKNSAELTIEEIVECEDSIAQFEANHTEAKFYSDWLNKQTEFASKCRSIYGSHLSGWGCYYYYVPFQAKMPNGEFKDKEFKVWQLFCKAYASKDKDEYNPFFSSWRTNRGNLPSFKAGNRTFVTSVYDEILSFIDKLNELYPGEIQVILANSDEADNSIIDKHFVYLKNQLSERSIRTSTFTKSPLSVEEKVHYVVIELITTNPHLSDICESLLSVKRGCYSTCVKSYKNTCFSNIVYISLLKEYDESESDDLLAKEKEKIRKAEEEQKQKEAERARKAEEERKAAERKRQEINELRSCVSSWPQPNRSTIEYFSLYYYYPTTCDWNASESEWDVRNLIWDFKAKPHNYQSESEILQRHKASVDKILPLLRKALHHFFGSRVRKLTIVPIPASTKVVCDRRYKDVMERISSDMDMYNGYTHMTITKEGISKNDPGNTTGRSIPPEVEFDKKFFNGKYVILFDDVITSGASMERYKRLLEAAGATVIGGLSLGKTKHERQGKNPIDDIH